ncbi:MAG: hypothetical protein ACT4PW_01870 [Acidimicrobiia bacterium]
MDRMFTVGSRFFYILGVLAFGGAMVYGLGARGGLNGVLSLGVDGGVGEHTGLVILVFTFIVSVFLGSVTIAFRDANAHAVTAVAQTDTVPEVPAPASASYWPLAGAFGAVSVALGLVVSAQLFVFGVLVLILVLLEWMVSTWADRATGDAEVNRRIRNRLMMPVEVPLFGAIAIVGVVLGISRALLALSKSGAWIVAGLVAVLVLGAAVLVSVMPHGGRKLARGLLVAGALAVLASGIVGAVEGSREYHPHEAHFEPTAPDRLQPVPGLPTESQAGH